MITAIKEDNIARYIEVSIISYFMDKPLTATSKLLIFWFIKLLVFSYFSSNFFVFFFNFNISLS
ncbi:hypothetical protein PPV_Vac110-(074-075)n1 [Avipoxvirus sp.]|nr:hypothetical protein PPV_Vac110-(074-075)n1 [Avipoxvirus sp.]